MSENASTGTEGTTETGTPSKNEPTTVEQLPEFARNLITDLRQESAKHRTNKTTAVEAAKLEAKTEFEAKLAESNNSLNEAKTALGKSNLELAKLNAAIEAGVPTDKLKDFAGLLQGNTAEELSAHAATVKTMFNIPTKQAAVDPSTGKSSEQPSEDDFGAFITNMLNR